MDKSKAVLSTPPSPSAPSAPIAVCLPTYNEAGHIRHLLAEIRAVLPSAYLLVIDDDSPDGTADVVAEIAGEDARVHLLRRPAKTGLGDAYRAGFAHALERWNPSLVVQMDADLSHPVPALTALLERASTSGLVIGSRYVATGGVVRWHRVRQSISRLGGAYARLCLGLPVTDPTSGFRVWQGRVLQDVCRHEAPARAVFAGD